MEYWPFHPHKTETNNIDLYSRLYAGILDRRVAFDLGPVAKNDTSEGLSAYVWRARLADNGKVYICRQNDSNTGWLEEEERFDTYTNNIIREISLSFDQNARPMIGYVESTVSNDATHREISAGGTVKLHWYDPAINDTAIREICEGRDVQVYLDDRYGVVGDSDVLIFAVQPQLDRMVYFRQRDRYDTAFEVGVTNVAYKYLELVTMGLDRRLHIYYSDYGNSDYGRDNNYCAEASIANADSLWRMRVVKSGLYPIPLDAVERAEIGKDSVLSGVLQVVFLENTLDVKKIEIGSDSVLSGILKEAMLSTTINIGKVEMGDSVLSGILNVAMITNTINIGKVEMGRDSVLSGILQVIFFENTAGIEKVEIGGDSIISGVKVED